MNRTIADIRLHSAYFITGLKVRYTYWRHSDPHDRDKTAVVFILLICTVMIVMLSVYAVRTSSTNKPTATSVSQHNPSTYKLTSNPPAASEPPAPPQSPVITPIPTPAPNEGSWYPVDRVVDGDTVRILDGATSESVRLIGVDTPETVDTRKPIQCYGPEASAYAKQLMPSGEKVRLVIDASQGNTDKYGRLLRYVFLSDGTNVDYTLIRKGFGREYTYNTPYRYQSDFRTAEKSAQAEKLGLWSAC